jgi:predicted dehydrogenase
MLSGRLHPLRGARRVLSSPYVAVVGTGSAGTRHLEVLATLPAVTAIPISKQRGRVAEDLREAAAKGATLCIVATDTRNHVEDATLAIDLGFDVCVEKPLATTAQEAVALHRYAIERERKLFVGCVLRFSESLNVFRSRLPVAGALHSVRIECQSYLPDWRPDRAYKESYSARLNEGGVLLDLVHEIDYAGWLFGWPKAIHARVRNFGRLGIASEEIAELNWDTGEFTLSMTLDYLTRPPRRYIRAAGELGTVEWDGVHGTVTISRPESGHEIVRSTQTRLQMFAAQDEAFINTKRELFDPRLAAATEGINALAVCDAARCAATSYREEPVRYS